MRKLYTTSKYRRYNSKRASNRLARSLRRRKRSKAKRKASSPVPTPERIVAPANFSFINSPNEMSEFVARLGDMHERKASVFVDLSSVVEMDHSAITVLMAALVSFKADGIRFNGNFPLDEELKKRLDTVIGTLYRKNFTEEEEYTIHDDLSYGVYAHAMKTVDSGLTAWVIGNCAEMIWGERRRCQGVQSSLIELMHNTNNHANQDAVGQYHWWLSVSNDQKDPSKVSFVFLDFGIGILASLDSKPVESKWGPGWRMLKSLVESEASLLEKILAGELHRTVTGHSYRGKGLPHIAAAQERNQLSKLCVISNHAYCNRGLGDVRSLSTPFSGTLVYWELDRTNENCR